MLKLNGLHGIEGENLGLLHHPKLWAGIAPEKDCEGPVYMVGYLPSVGHIIHRACGEYGTPGIGRCSTTCSSVVWAQQDHKN